jgi:hypothetical protein
MLKDATTMLLSTDDQAEIHAALDAIHTMFAKITSVRADKLTHAQHLKETIVKGGVAISPHMAALCLLDPLRTVQFLRGIHAAIHEAMHRFPAERIHIVYAGCGPYATLLLPLTTQFSSDQIALTLIDIHKPSIEGVKCLIAALGVAPYVVQCIQANAITYRHPAEMPLHMVVSETMQTGLAREPQFAIMRNFLPQLAENGLFIPESIVVDACLSSSQEEDIGLLMGRDEYRYPVGRKLHSQVERLPLGRIITLNASFAHPDVIGAEWDTIPLATLRIPPRDPGLDQFLLMTAVSIFGSYHFAPYDCELSFPLKLHDLTQAAPGTEIRFSYRFGQNPKLQHEVISHEALAI